MYRRDGLGPYQRRTLQSIGRMTGPVSILIVFQIASQCICIPGGNVDSDVYLPELRLKTITPQPPSFTPLPVTEKELWGLRLWQVVGLFFAGTMLLIVFCCCLCDCRIPKIQNEKQPQDSEENSDNESNADRVMPNADRVIPNSERMAPKSGWARVKHIVDEQAQEIKETRIEGYENRAVSQDEIENPQNGAVNGLIP